MSDAGTYDERVRAIRAYNQPILEDFRTWLAQSGISEKTVKEGRDQFLECAADYNSDPWFTQ